MSFTVTLKPSGRQFSVEASETVLEAALRQGVGIPYGCRSGQCGQCAARVSAGVVDYPQGEPPALTEQAEGMAILCQAVPRSDLRCVVELTEQAEAIEPRTLPCKVAAKERLNHDVMRLKLKLPEGQRLQFLAGQYLDFILADGRRRAFSIANAPHDDAFIELHIRHVEGGAFTEHVFNEMQEGELLRIQAPLGRFTLDEGSDRPILFVAGGTGFAPIKAMIEHAFHVGFARPMHLYWGVRTEADLYLPDLPRGWAAERPAFAYDPVLSEPGPDWKGRRGFVHQAVLADHPDLSGHDAYLAGPPPMIEAARTGFLAAGMPGGRMFSDAFEYAAPSDRSG